MAEGSNIQKKRQKDGASRPVCRFVKLARRFESFWFSGAAERYTTIDSGGLAAALGGRRRQSFWRRVGSGATAPMLRTRQN